MQKNNKQPEKTTEYEKRVTAMKLAIQHSRNCHSDTLVKLAKRIYDFINGKNIPTSFTNNE